MNLLDAVIALLVVLAAVGGYRLGFVTRVASWLGMAVGLYVAVQVLPPVLEALRGSSQTRLLLVTLGLIFFFAFAGQAIGLVVGTKLRPATSEGTVTRADGVGGALAAIVGVLVAFWLLLPVLAGTPGAVASQVTSSRVAQFLDANLPEPPETMQALRSLFGEDNFPVVFDVLRPTPDLGPPPGDSGLDDETTARVRRSVVKVEGIACNQIQDGTGFVAAPEIVVTNAHVVAGEPRTEVIRDDGRRVRADVVAFDPNRDLAVLRVPGVDRPALAVAASSPDARGGVFAHPGGGPLRVAPFDVARVLDAVGRDIYGTGVTRREVLELAASLRQGDSGSALVDDSGRVVGVAFAIAPDRPNVAYALSTDELRAVLDGDLSRAVATGPCTGAG